MGRARGCPRQSISRRRPSPFCPAPPSPRSLSGLPVDPQCSLLVSPGIPRATCPPWALTQRLADISQGCWLMVTWDAPFSSSNYLWRNWPDHVNQHQEAKSGYSHLFGALRVCQLPLAFPNKLRRPSGGCELAPCTFVHSPSMPGVQKVLHTDVSKSQHPVGV